MTVATTYTITFGLLQGSNTPVTEDQWFLFLTSEVCPLLKHFSLRDELGFWNNEPEPCRVLTYVTQEFNDGISIHAIASHYKARFNQQAVFVNSFASFPDLV